MEPWEVCDREGWCHEIAQEQWYVVMAAIGARQSRVAWSPDTFVLEIFLRHHAWIWVDRVETECLAGNFVRN